MVRRTLQKHLLQVLKERHPAEDLPSDGVLKPRPATVVVTALVVDKEGADL